MCNFWFYSVVGEKKESGKSIRVYQDEAYANLDKFMQRSKGKEDRAATCHRLKANELRKYLSRISQPLKKVNDDKGDVRNQNYAYALAELKSRGFYDAYLKDNQTLYELDLVEKQGEPSSQVTKSVDYLRFPMPSQLTVSRNFLHRLDAYFRQNKKFKRDKKRNAIQVSILPDDDDEDAWSSGWYVKVNAREFCHQLASINYRVRAGDRFDSRQRNEICLSNLFRMFDWTIYKEDIKNVIAISVHERKLRASSDRLPFDSTLRLDQFFDRDELATISLLLVASFHHVCKCEEEYCHLRVTPRPLLVPNNDDETTTSRKRKRGGGGDER